MDYDKNKLNYLINFYAGNGGYFRRVLSEIPVLYFVHLQKLGGMGCKAVGSGDIESFQLEIKDDIRNKIIDNKTKTITGYER